MISFKKITASDEGCELFASCIIESDQPFFNGHFSGMPIMPAAAQLDLIGTLLKTDARWDQLIIGGRALKFLNRIQPGDVVEIRLVRKSSTEVSFTLERESVLLTKGFLRLSEGVGE